MLGRTGVRADQAEYPIGVVCAGCPYLLSIDDILIALDDRARLKTRQVGTGIWLTIALAPPD